MKKKKIAAHAHQLKESFEATTTKKFTFKQLKQFSKECF